MKAGEANAERFKSSKPEFIVETQLDISPIQLGINILKYNNLHTLSCHIFFTFKYGINIFNLKPRAKIALKNLCPGHFENHLKKYFKKIAKLEQKLAS